MEEDGMVMNFFVGKSTKKDNRGRPSLSSMKGLRWGEKRKALIKAKVKAGRGPEAQPHSKQKQKSVHATTFRPTPNFKPREIAHLANRRHTNEAAPVLVHKPAEKEKTVPDIKREEPLWRQLQREAITASTPQPEQSPQASVDGEPLWRQLQREARKRKGIRNEDSWMVKESGKSDVEGRDLEEMKVTLQEENKGEEIEEGGGAADDDVEKGGEEEDDSISSEESDRDEKEDGANEVANQDLKVNEGSVEENDSEQNEESETEDVAAEDDVEIVTKGNVEQEEEEEEEEGEEEEEEKGDDDEEDEEEEVEEGEEMECTMVEERVERKKLTQEEYFVDSASDGTEAKDVERGDRSGEFVDKDLLRQQEMERRIVQEQFLKRKCAAASLDEAKEALAAVSEREGPEMVDDSDEDEEKEENREDIEEESDANDGEAEPEAGNDRTEEGKTTKDLDGHTSGASRVQNSALFDKGGFDALALSPTLINHIERRMGLKRPTNVQVEAVKALVPKDDVFRDAMIRSETGSGKTFAFLFPIAHALLERKKKVDRTEGTLAVIIEPTRELAAQVEIAARELFRPWHWIVVSAVMGGEKKKSEKARLRKGVTVLITTPGRIVDHLRSTVSLNLSRCEWLIFDEADRLLDLGFGPNIRETIETLNQRARDRDRGEEQDGKKLMYRKRRQTVLLSATVTDDVIKLADLSLSDPARILIGEEGNDANFKVPDKLQQHYCIVDQRYRLVTLIAMLRLRARADPNMKAVVFFSSCDAVDFYYALFSTVKYPDELFQFEKEEEEEEGEMEEEDEDKNDDKEDTERDVTQGELKDLSGNKANERKRKQPKVSKTSLCRLPLHKIHGSMPQIDRISTFRKFLAAPGGILFSTDVSARGVDLSKVNLSVQFDPPTHDEDIEYVHRVGRTARIGSSGDALLFVLPEEEAFVEHLAVNRGFQMKEISADAALAALRGNVRIVEKAARMVTSVLQSALQNAVASDQALRALASTGYRSYICAYKTHGRSVKKFFNTSNLHLGHVARSFALKGDPMTINEVRRMHEGPSFQRKNQSQGTRIARGPNGNVFSAYGVTKRERPRSSGYEGFGNAQSDHGNDRKGNYADISAGSKRRRRTTLRTPNARAMLTSEFGA